MTDIFAIDLRQTIAEMIDAGIPAGKLLTVLDFTGLSVLPQELIPLFEEFVGKEGFISERIAIITTSKLVEMQWKWMTKGLPQYRYFNDASQGFAWARNG